MLLALFNVVLVTILNRRSPNSDTIQTWTCKFSTNVPDLSLVSQSVDLTNQKFSLLCGESVRKSPPLHETGVVLTHYQQFGFYGMISILCLEFVLALAVTARWFTDKPAVPLRYEGYPVRGAKIENDGFSF